MNGESPTVVAGTQNALNNYRRLFFTHVGAVVLTGALVVPLLLGVTSIPSWVSVSYCVIIATVAIAFVFATAKNWRDDREISVAKRIECLVLSLGLSMVQAIFIFPVLVCVYAPTLRL